ncbi:hypothetical protein F2Q68_00003537 [Brassica cretica]|uniref:Uncharacterized protein n=1 Tax=Brassica cretica TaxID=69181 RepID=A0A8S9JAA9_BRACR|nr:hypothetical protein F2Q68_00003537 [Brassica cretica]
MKASQFICWINEQASGVTLLFHCGEEMVTSRCLLKDVCCAWVKAAAFSFALITDQSLSQKRMQHQQSIHYGTQSSISQLARGNHVEDEARPVGVKASKAKGKKSVSKQATLEEEEKERMEFQNVWDLRQKEPFLQVKQRRLVTQEAKTKASRDIKL